jgi:hypothetical protein
MVSRPLIRLTHTTPGWRESAVPLSHARFEHRTNNAGKIGHELRISVPFLTVEPFASGPINCPTDPGSKHVVRHSGPSGTFSEAIKHHDSNRPCDSGVQ